MEKIKSLFRKVRSALSPAPDAWRAAALAALALGLVLLLLQLLALVFSDFTAWKLLGFMTGYLAILLALSLLYLGARLLSALPRRLALALVLALPAVVIASFELGTTITAGLLAGGLLALMLAAGSLAGLYRDGFDVRANPVAATALALALVAGAAIIYFNYLDYEEPNPLLADYRLANATLALADPATPGDYAVGYTTYGSGTDRHRPEYGAEVGFRTEAVDASRLIDNWDGLVGWTRSGYWGFDAGALPVQARVWYPEAPGLFPLVLIVHGNHGMEDFSDPGYEYLGRLLASRGYVFASVDENFLNSSIGDTIDLIDSGLQEENDARGWLLLEHLVQWREWSATPGHFFYNRVDMDNISLIGHSRGGEAVAIASHLNRLSHYPDDASLGFDYDFAIRGVIAIAPVDGQYQPRNTPTPVSDVNYFVIHGSMDADVTSFAGLRQYNRVELADPRQFKAALYVSGANHGQFNTGWGDQDLSMGWSLRKSSIMPGDEQRRIAEVYFSAFLDIVHKDRRAYLPLFESASYGADWLPDTFYINNYQKLYTRWLANFEEDGDPGSGSMEGLRIEGSGLSRWSEAWQELKYNDLDSHVLRLAWDARYGSPASLSLALARPINLANYQALVFSASQGSGSTLPDDFEPEETDSAESGADGDEPTTLDWTLVLVDQNGNTARRRVSEIEPLYPQVQADTLMAQYGYSTPRMEAVLKYFSFDLDRFQPDDPGFDLSRIGSIRFQFDQNEKGSLILDDIGLI